MDKTFKKDFLAEEWKIVEDIYRLRECKPLKFSYSGFCKKSYCKFCNCNYCKKLCRLPHPLYQKLNNVEFAHNFKRKIFYFTLILFIFNCSQLKAFNINQILS